MEDLTCELNPVWDVKPQNLDFGGIRVVCTRRITGTDLGTVALVISNYTTTTDLVSMVVTKCKSTGIKSEDYCVVMETGFKEKGGGLETQILKDDDKPLEMQSKKPKGQVRFGVQPRNGVVVKVYDGRIWPVTVFGDVYITTEFTTQLVIHHLLSSSLPRKQLNKYTLAIGSSQGKIQRFLNDVEQPVRVLQEAEFKSSDDFCFLIVKKPKTAKKPMFRSLSWASISKLGQGQSMNPSGNTLQNDGRKQKKFRLKKKKDVKSSADTYNNSDTTSSDEYLHNLGQNLTSTPIKRSNSVYTNGDHKLNGGLKPNNHPMLNGSVSDAPLRKGNFSLSGMPQNSSLTSFYSCDDIHTITPRGAYSPESESEMSSTEIAEEKRSKPLVPPQFSERRQHSNQRQVMDLQEEGDTLSDLQVVLRTRSLGDLTSNQGLTLPQSQSSVRETWHESSREVQTRYVHSAGSSRTVAVNPPVAKREVQRQRPIRQNRRSCVARIEDKENQDYLEDYYGRSLQKTPRQRRSLPQIPNNDIDDKKKRLQEMMMRRLTVCNGEIANYLQETGHFTGSLNEIRDGRYISNAHIHLTPSDSVNSQTDLSLPGDQDFENQNGFRNSPVAIISSPRSPHSLIVGSQPYYSDNARRRTPDPFNDSPKLQRMPLINERDTTHTPLTRIAKNESLKPQYKNPRSRAALVDAQSEQEYAKNTPPSYHSVNRYPSNRNSGYNERSPSGDKQNNMRLYEMNSYQGNRAQVHSYPSNGSSYGTLPRGQPSNSFSRPSQESNPFSTLPRKDKNFVDRGDQRVPCVISPGKTLCETVSDPMNIVSCGSMVDSGYGTNGESDYGAGVFPNRPLQPQKVYSRDRSAICKQRSSDLSNGSFERSSLESPPDPVTAHASPSFYQLLSACTIHTARLFLPSNKIAANLIRIHEDSILLPLKKTDSDKRESPKGRCALSLGGPGSAFKRVRTNPRDTKCYNLISLEAIENVCQPKQGEITVERGDFIIEINGRVTLGMDFSSVLTILENQKGGQLEMVVARKKPVERVPETLTSEISKLRQQCAYLITEVKSKERIITDLSTVGPGETTQSLQQEQQQHQQASLTLDPPIPRQEAYYTCELSEDEFIV